MSTDAAKKEIKKSLIAMEQMSWDESFEILTRLGLTYNPVSGDLERETKIQGNSSLALNWNADGTLASIVKTIGATSYTKTFTWTDGNLTGISAWS